MRSDSLLETSTAGAGLFSAVAMMDNVCAVDWLERQLVPHVWTSQWRSRICREEDRGVHRRKGISESRSLEQDLGTIATVLVRCEHNIT